MDAQWRSICSNNSILAPAWVKRGQRPRSRMGNVCGSANFPPEMTASICSGSNMRRSTWHRRCSLNVTQSRLQAVGDSDVLMLIRFDRDHTDKGYLRFGVVSGLTVLDVGTAIWTASDGCTC